MMNLNNNKKNTNSIVRAAKVLSLATIILLIAGVITTTLLPLTALGSRFGGEETGFINPTTGESKAPVVVSGDNIYIAWGTNNTVNGNEEVMFRASNDGGATFGEERNISTSVGDSVDAEIAAEGENVIVTWWELPNQTSAITLVARISNDGGETFGPDLRLATNGTIGVTEEEEEAAATADDEGGE